MTETRYDSEYLGDTVVQFCNICLWIYLTVCAGLNHLPGLRVYIIAVELVGQGVIRRSTKHIQVTVECDHGVAVAPLGRRGGSSQ